MNFDELINTGHGGNERKAALYLYALHPQDRQWVMQSLPQADRAVLEGLLTELSGIGLVPDLALVQEFTQAQASASCVDPGALSDIDFLEKLNAQAISDLALALSKEPTMLSAKCLQVHHWPWTERLLSELPAPYRQKIERLPRHLATTEETSCALRQALTAKMRQICERAPNPIPVQPITPAPSTTWWSSIQRRIEKRKRSIRA